MSRQSSRCAQRALRLAAARPAVAGFRPRAAAAAVAAAFALQPVLAQPAGGQAVHGQATFATHGANLVVRTQNGIGTSHSTINWQSFSIPAGSTTRFFQPSSTSTSINRVLGPDPSAIYGTLWSNGKLVLVNPAGITVGPGGVVDTAGFIASTLRLGEADAVAGRLLFQGGNGAPVQVDGQVIARRGDVVLVGTNVHTGPAALVQAEDGAVVLAAGNKVALTGRGLEGIQLEVQAGNEARNLGMLRGDAVGVFASTLRHSGVVAANAVSTEGGKVVLKAIGGDALVDGAVTAKKGDRGGSIDLLGQRVALLAGANVDASASAGGGQVRIGGDYQGRNATVPNATHTSVDAQATVKADATVQGDGGRVIVWSDEATRMDGRISARGGAQGGNGGFVEVSGKRHLAFTGRVDLRAPKGANGLLLLDPEDITIVAGGTGNSAIMSSGAAPDFQFASTGGASQLDADTLIGQLAYGNVLVTTAAPSGTGGQITVATGADVTWTNDASLTLRAGKGITVNGTLSNTASDSAGIHLDAGGGNIDINAGATVQAATVTMQTPQDVNILNGGIAARKGVLAITAGGDVSLAQGAYLTTDKAPITVQAGGSILGQGSFGTGGRNASDATGGKVTLTASGGSISFYDIDATGYWDGPGFHGADVVLDAKTGVTGTYVATSAGSSAGSPGLNAGGVSITAGGAVDVSSIDATGGHAYEDSAPDGSPIAAGNGGQGGRVVVNAGTGANVGSVYAYGGDSSGYALPAAQGGTAGTVTLTTAAGDLAVGSVDAAGGWGAGGANGGTVTLSAPGKVRIGEVYAAGGDSSGAAAGGTGGTVSINAGGDVVNTGYGVIADGGYSDGGAGGAGGTIAVSVGGALVSEPSEGPLEAQAAFSEVPFGFFVLSATGGNGGAGASGGSGGSIRVSATGNLVLDSTVYLLAVGGQGGDVGTTAGGPGAGGAGGLIDVHSGGTVYLRSPLVYAWGGASGYDGNDEQTGPAGGLGTFSAMGQSVQVEGDFDLNAVWNNNSNVHVRGSSFVYGVGKFVNFSDVVLYDNASLQPNLGVENKGRLITFGNNQATLVHNSGLVDVTAASTLWAPGFVTNNGTVNVNGTLQVGTSTPPQLLTDCTDPLFCALAASFPGTSFTNASGATLSGSGTIMVDGGSGTVDNFGTIAPGGAGTVGTLNVAGNLVMEPGSTVAIDLLNTGAYDKVQVSGTAVTGGTIAVNALPGAGYAVGDVFDVLQASVVDSSAAMPASDRPDLSVAVSATAAQLVAGTPVTPPPPASSGDALTAPEQQVLGELVTFAELFVEEAQRQDEVRRIGKDDIVVTDTACTPR
jgi:filamentous hemagglutinin family protein